LNKLRAIEDIRDTSRMLCADLELETIIVVRLSQQFSKMPSTKRTPNL
jgi:hypothetical protein